MNSHRLAQARESLASNHIQGLLVLDKDNIRWLTGFSGSSGLALLTNQDLHIFTDGRYTIQAGEEAKGAVIHISNDSPVKQVANYLKDNNAGTIGFESDVMSVDEHRQFIEIFDSTSTVALVGIINQLRSVKDSFEIGAIRAACRVTDAAFTQILSHIKLGTTELMVVRDLVYALGSAGADKESFDSIVAFGSNSALPHAKPGERQLVRDQPVLLDFGAKKNGYVGDVTRTVFVGKASNEFTHIYNVVLEAQLAAIDAIRPGIAGRDVDSVAREIISKAGYGDKFSHGLGHQIGLHVHDGPALSQRSPVTLEEGMVVTVEPGIYIEGWGGVRIEDDVLITSSGAELLTFSDKHLIEL